MTCPLYQEWQWAKYKEDDKFYSSEEFRNDYTRIQMPQKAENFEKLVGEYLSQVTLPADGHVQILSLGCGPGSDLLGSVRAICNSAKVTEIRTICCLGVDKNDWTFNRFDYEIGKIKRSRRNCPIIRSSIIIGDMDNFAYNAELEGKKYHIITLSYVNAMQHVNVIGKQVIRLLENGGGVFVIDVNMPQVRRLARTFGFIDTGLNRDSASLYYAYLDKNHIGILHLNPSVPEELMESRDSDDSFTDEYYRYLCRNDLPESKPDEYRDRQTRQRERFRQQQFEQRRLRQQELEQQYFRQHIEQQRLKQQQLEQQRLKKQFEQHVSQQRLRKQQEQQQQSTVSHQSCQCNLSSIPSSRRQKFNCCSGCSIM